MELQHFFLLVFYLFGNSNSQLFVLRLKKSIKRIFGKDKLFFFHCGSNFLSCLNVTSSSFPPEEKYKKILVFG